MDFESLSTRYRGAVAATYDARRTAAAKWTREQAAVAGALAGLPAGAAVLDVPVGTGRFLELYRRGGLRPTGVDVSPDMLAIAADKARALGLAMSLAAGDIRHIPAGDASFDVAVCVRFLNWVDAAAVRSIVAELARVSGRSLIVGIRHEAALADLRLPSRSGLRRLAGQLWRRLKRRALAQLRRPRARIIVHDKGAVMDAFRASGLAIRSAVLIDAGRNGSDYCIYVLDRARPPWPAA